MGTAMRWRGMVSGLLAATVVAAVAPASPARADDRSTYLVVLRDGAGDPAAVGAALVARVGGTLGFVYRNALPGFAASLPAVAVDALRLDPLVASIEPDQVLRMTAETVPTGIRRIQANRNPVAKINGVDDVRIDVDIAVIDTGIDATHPDLNVVGRVDCTNAKACVSGGTDNNGHGTHVAGTAAAIDNGFGVVGVAPGARLWSVKVLGKDGSGSLTGIMAGLDWVAGQSSTIEVVNLSLGCADCGSKAMSRAISAAVDRGVVVVVAAGNDATDASRFFPANHPDAITVSALADFDGAPGGSGPSTCLRDADDSLAPFSNYGTVVDVAAPGACIYSTYPGGRYATMSGTSMAAPHVTGAAALLAAGVNDPTSRADVAAITARIKATGSHAWTDDSNDGRQEPLLNARTLG